MHAFRWSLQLHEKGREIEAYIVDYELVDAIFWGKTSDQLRHMASNTGSVSSEKTESSKDEESDKESGEEGNDEKRDSSDDDDSQKENDKKPNEEPDDGNSDDSKDDRNDGDEESEDEDEIDDDSSDTGLDDDEYDQMPVVLATTNNITTGEHEDVDRELELDIDPEERQDPVASAQKTSEDNSEAHQNEVVGGGRHISNRIDSQEDSDGGSGDEKDADFLEDTSQGEDGGEKKTDKQQGKRGTTMHRSRSKSSGIKKKRKRSPSPPWKSAAAEVPSTVEDEHGRRKSGRVMFGKR